ncbi:toxin-antitoxin system YwqK family antitoxin, partial [Fulvivirga kasyanovii]|nr:toxin-antitoxin system YwqK family antitoxin [Fulvivirga kasyanovii]
TVNGNGKFEDHYQRNRTISHSGEVKDGKKTGTWKMYYENGNIQAQGVFDDNDIFVINKFWNKTGNLLVEDGNGTVSLTSGNTYESGRLINGYRDGVWQVLDDSGILYSETTYKNGKADGAQKFYYPSEALNIEGYNSDDKKNGLWYWYYENGQVETSLTYVNDKKDGVQEFYNEQGTKVKEEIYKDGELVNEILVNLQ